MFTKERLEDIPKSKREYKDPQRLVICVIEINEEIAVYKFQKLRDDKASGAGDLVQIFLSKIGNKLAQPLARIYHKITYKMLSYRRETALQGAL